MPEILTESFCERCGTRYTFETEAPRAKRFGKFKVLSKGLKNYVLSDESSLDEALADARNDEDRQASGQQLDAFHKTFNFCMSCRQYTCANCWNEVESRCLSCAPHLGHEVLEAPFQTPDPFARIASLTASMSSNGHEQDLEAPTIEAAWPTADLGRAPAADATPADADTDADAKAETDAETDAVSRLESLFAIASRQDEPNRAPAPQAPPSPAPQAPPAPRADAPPPVAAAGDAARRPAAEAFAPTAPDAAADATSTAPKATPAPAKDVKPLRDIALEVSLFEEGTAKEKAEALAAAAAEAAAQAASPTPPAAPAPAPRSAVAKVPAASDAPYEALPSELDALDERAAAALSNTADFLTRFRSTSGLPTNAAPEPVVEAAIAPEPEPVVPPAAPAQLPAAADQVRPQIDRIEFPTWHIDTPAAPIGQPSGRPSEPTIVPTTPGPAMQPSVQARWPEPEARTTPSFPVPSPEPAPSVLQAMSQPAAVTPPAVTLPAAMPPAAQPPAAQPPAALPTAAQPEWPSTPPQWPVAPSWPSNRAKAAQVSGVDAMWAASSRDVLSRAETGVQSCVNCGLPLSATARFCRRCGANQIQA